MSTATHASPAPALAGATQDAVRGGIVVTGTGAVSPAGWGVPALLDAVRRGEPLPCVPLAHPGRELPLPSRPVPAPTTRPVFLGHARLRRTSPIAQHCLGAAVEALGTGAGGPATAGATVGVIACVLAGCVNYSRRFLDETLRDPASASPLVFPETVFNAPASHIAAFLGSTAECCTLVGDGGMFLQGLALGADWLLAGKVETVVVVGADELDWLVGGAHELFEAGVVQAAGAGAVCLRREGVVPGLARLEAVTDAIPYTRDGSRIEALRRVRASLPAGAAGEMLVLSGRGGGSSDAAEREIWANWPGSRCAPSAALGTAFNAGTAWQVVVGCEAVARGEASAATVSVIGANQQAIGARFA